MDLSEISDNKKRHPWELARSDCILSLLRKWKKRTHVLDVGCGDAFFDIRLLETMPDINMLWGVDVDLKDDYKIERGCFCNSIDKVNITSFDIILLMDVLEHIEDDITFLKSLKTKLNQTGRIYITVPAVQKLFSIHDKRLRHIRRYEYKQIIDLLDKCGYTVELCSYFFFTLYIVRLLSINSPHRLSDWKFNQGNLRTIVLRFALFCDFNICLLLKRIGISIKGLSLVCIAYLKDE